MGAEERFRKIKMERERAQFDAHLAMAVRSGDERAFPADKFGLVVKPGVLLMHFPQEPTPPICTVTEVQPVLDPRAPAGALRIRMVHDLIVPAGVPNPYLLVVGDAPVEAPASDPGPEVSIERPAEAPTEEKAGPKLVLTDAQ